MPIFIGDAHGKFGAYKTIIKKHRSTIQVGDMGVGFRRWPHGNWEANPPYDVMVEHNAQFIRGNHDNPQVCDNHTQWIPDGLYENGIMYVGGADSIDKAYRVEGYSWWPDEELSKERLNECIQTFRTEKPEIMVTHDCPQEIANMIFATLILPFNRGMIPLEVTRTRDAFQQMFAAHQPRIWVFGHWHTPFDCVVEGTRFVCLPELEVKELE